MKKIYHLLPVLFSGLCYSCIAPYQMTTTFTEKGEVTRDIYTAVTRQETGALDTDPFPFISEDGWTLSQVDTFYLYYAGKPQAMNARATRNYSSLEVAQQTRMKQPMQEFFSPREQFKKQFRWFYTYYTYEACFPEAGDKGKVPIETYLSPDEITVWLTGKNKDIFFRGMNGMEINQLLQAIEEKFLTWLKHNLFEVSWEVLEKRTAEQGDPQDLIRIRQIDRTAFFERYFIKKQYSPEEERDVSTGMVTGLLDNEFSTNNFSHLYTTYKKEMDEEVDAWWNRMEPDQGIVLKYEVKLPGTLVQTNTELFDEGTPFWQITLATLWMEDYTLTAQSRTANAWAFIVTFLFIGITAGTLFRRKRK
ncbi:MAG: hypothetical protein LUG98_00075 [Tannerellaceae bacterium]|nr:hypothetical protein [Tannerellaceae bacterium]